MIWALLGVGSSADHRMIRGRFLEEMTEFYARLFSSSFQIKNVYAVYNTSGIRQKPRPAVNCKCFLCNEVLMEFFLNWQFNLPGSAAAT